MRKAGLEETQAGIKIAGRNINNLRYADDTTLMVESEEKLKSLLRTVKEESKRVGLKFKHSENEDHGIRMKMSRAFCDLTGLQEKREVDAEQRAPEKKKDSELTFLQIRSNSSSSFFHENHSFLIVDFRTKTELLCILQ